MQSALTSMDWINHIGLGAILGAAGQVIRQIAGLKKLIDEHPGKSLGATLDSSRIVMTLLIGAVAGILATLLIDTPDQKFTSQALLGLMSAGYAGTDFIESFMKREENK